MFTQLNPPLRLYVPGKGSGTAYGVLDYGIDFDLHWIVFLDTGEIWALKNQDVRGIENVTLGRKRSEER